MKTLKTVILLLLMCIQCAYAAKESIVDNRAEISIDTDNFSVSAKCKNGKTAFVPADGAGLFINGVPVVSAKTESSKENSKAFILRTKDGTSVKADVSLNDGVCAICIKPQNSGTNTVELKFGGVDIAYGLGDAGGFSGNFNLVGDKEKTYEIINNGGGQRWASTFTLFPKNSAAAVFFDRGKRSVKLGKEVFSMSSTRNGQTTFYLIIGTPQEIYSSFKSIKSKHGYVDLLPKPRLFEIGWESWDALGWNTNQNSVSKILSKFLKEGYPIKWAVVGSGFWDEGGTTTSFGRFGAKFPNPEEFRAFMRSNDIAWMIGLRVNLIPSGGPYYPKTKKRDRNLKVVSFYGNPLSDEAKSKDILLLGSDGSPLKLTSHVFPIVPCYLVDGNRPGAAEWYLQQYKKWGVDGIKEDTMMPLGHETSIFNRTISNLESNGALVMARCGEFSSPGTLLRINDTRVSDFASRMPINYLQYAICGAPNVYSDVAGVHNMHKLKDTQNSLRQSWLISLTAGYALGAYPDNWPESDARTFKKIAEFHHALVPYLYSAAMKSFKTGFPYTLTPLCLIEPENSNVYSLDDYQWLIGESILAAPLLAKYKDGKRDIYLPSGVWFDFDSSKKFSGGQVLKSVEMPTDKTPCFVGGKGIIILRDKNGSLTARIYAVGKTVNEDFYSIKDGKKFSISVKNSNIFSATVKKLSDGKLVPVKKHQDAYISFPVSDGESYIVE